MRLSPPPFKAGVKQTENIANGFITQRELFKTLNTDVPLRNVRLFDILF